MPSSPPSVATLPPRARVERLLTKFKGRQRALLLTHDNPDPDSIASAWALGTLLEQRLGVVAQVAYGGIIGRAENLAFVKQLEVPMTPASEVDLEDFDLFGILDTQQDVKNHALYGQRIADIVIDHHPLREGPLRNPYADVGGVYGATSTMLTEYLRAEHIEPSPALATALYYGIKADTRDLGRQTQPHDVDCYLWLFPRIDRAALAAIENPELPRRYFRLFHLAFERARVYGTGVVTDLGEVYTPDIVPEVAERLARLEGTTWSLAMGSYHSQLFLSLRSSDGRRNAGRLIRDVCADLGGSAGGHGSMAGARLPLAGRRSTRDAVRRELVKRFKHAFGVDGVRGASLLAEE